MVLVSAEDRTWCLKEIIRTVCQQSFTEVCSTKTSVKYSYHQKQYDIPTY